MKEISVTNVNLHIQITSVYFSNSRQFPLGTSSFSIWTENVLVTIDSANDICGVCSNFCVRQSLY
jgi:hypothetical protein